MGNELETLQQQFTDLGDQLSTQELKFCTALIEGKSRAEASEHAGYEDKNPANNAHMRLLRKPEMQEYIMTAKHIAIVMSQNMYIANVHEKRAMLWETAQRCFQTLKPKVQGGDDLESATPSIQLVW